MYELKHVLSALRVYHASARTRLRDVIFSIIWTLSMDVVTKDLFLSLVSYLLVRYDCINIRFVECNLEANQIMTNTKNVC